MYTSQIKKKHTWWILTLLIVTFSCVDVALGAGRVDYTPLVGLPGAQGTGGGGLVGYFNRLYMLVVAVGAIIAFLKIAFAGVKYSLDGVVTHKQDAKDDIKGALFGLVILLVPFIILNTIYGGLTKLNVLDVASQLRVTTGTGGAPAGGTSPTTPPPPPPSGTNIRNVTNDPIGCTAIPDSTTGMNGETTYTNGQYDCSGAEATCMARTGGTVTREPTVPERILCSYTETTTCTPGINCPGDTGYVAA
jgi:hypothetical protein